jgi:hypothetical protein
MSHLPWNHREPLCETPFSQVTPDRRRQSYRFYFDEVMRSLSVTATTVSSVRGPDRRHRRHPRHALGTKPTGPGGVIEVLCGALSKRPSGLRLIQRVHAEFGINAEIRTTMIPDQAAAERARFVGSPTVRVNGRDVEPAPTWPVRTTWSVACTGTSIAPPGYPGGLGSVRPCAKQRWASWVARKKQDGQGVVQLWAM